MMRSHSKADLARVSKLAALAASTTFQSEADAAVQKICDILEFQPEIYDFYEFPYVPAPPPKQTWAFNFGVVMARILGGY
jgi:hypothetical protein